MADITMCTGSHCPRKMECYRHTAPQNLYRQSFFVTSPVEYDDDENHIGCEYFWQDEKVKNENRKTKRNTNPS